MRRLALLVPLAMLAGFLFTITTPTPAAACRCASGSNLEQKADFADVVVRGAVVRVESKPPNVYWMTVRVNRVYRGDAGPALRFRSVATTCGLVGTDTGGRELVWFFYEHRGRLEATGCNPPSKGRGVERALGPGEIPPAASLSQGPARELAAWPLPFEGLW